MQIKTTPFLVEVLNFYSFSILKCEHVIFWVNQLLQCDLSPLCVTSDLSE